MNALGVGTYTTILSLIIALPLAYVADRYEFWGKKWMGNLILLPIMLPPFVGAIRNPANFGTVRCTEFRIGVFGNSRSWRNHRLVGAGSFLGHRYSFCTGVYIRSCILTWSHPLRKSTRNGGGSFQSGVLPAGVDSGTSHSTAGREPGMFAGCTIVFIWSFYGTGCSSGVRLRPDDIGSNF